MPFDALEYVVRPYTAPNAQGQVIIPSTPKSSRDRATITWGSKATMPAAQGINVQVVCCKDTLTETTRKSDKIRIYQGGDKTSPNYIDWERPNTMDLKKKEHNSCDDDLAQISEVAAEVDAVLDAWKALFDSLTSTPDKNCSAQWKFQNPT